MKTAKINILDGIGEGGVTSRDVIEQLQALPKSVELIEVDINSMGGACHDGIAIYNALKGHSAKVVVSIIGMACSMGSVIAMAGDEIHMRIGSEMMIHNPWSESQGDGDAMRATAEMLDKTRDSLADIYQQRTGLSRERVLSVMKAETWLSPDEAKSLGFATHASDTEAQFGTYDYSQVGKLPARLFEKLQGKPLAKSKAETDEELKEDQDAKAKAAEGDDDDDEPKGEDEDEILADEEKEDDDEKSAKAMKAQISKYTKLYGAKAGVQYLTSGLSIESASAKHIERLSIRNRELVARVKELEATNITGEHKPLKRSGAASAQATADKSLAGMFKALNS